MPRELTRSEIIRNSVNATTISEEKSFALIGDQRYMEMSAALNAGAEKPRKVRKRVVPTPSEDFVAPEVALSPPPVTDDESMEELRRIALSKERRRSQVIAALRKEKREADRCKEEGDINGGEDEIESEEEDVFCDQYGASSMDETWEAWHIRKKKIDSVDALSQEVAHVTSLALSTVVEIAENRMISEQTRLKAATYLLDRMAGRPTMTAEVNHTGDAPGTIRVIAAVMPRGIEGIIDNRVDNIVDISQGSIVDISQGKISEMVSALSSVVQTDG